MPDPPGCCKLKFSTPAAVRCTSRSRSFDSKYSMLRRPSLIWPSRRESTAGLLVDWRMALAALIRARSRSILRCTLATVSSTFAMVGAGTGTVTVQQLRRGGRVVRLSADRCGEGEEVPGDGRRGVECSEPKQAPEVRR